MAFACCGPWDIARAAERGSDWFVFDWPSKAGLFRVARLWKIHWTSRAMAVVATSKTPRQRGLVLGAISGRGIGISCGYLVVVDEKRRGSRVEGFP